MQYNIENIIIDGELSKLLQPMAEMLGWSVEKLALETLLRYGDLLVSVPPNRWPKTIDQRNKDKKEQDSDTYGWYSTRDLAKKLDISHNTVYGWVRRGAVLTRGSGRAKKIKMSSIPKRWHYKIKEEK